MNNVVKLALAVLVGLPLISVAQESKPKLEEGQSSASCISHFVFSQEFLARYPRAGAACRQVKVEKGLKWARFDADVVSVKGDLVTADFVDSYDHSVGRVTFKVAADARVEVNGRDEKFSLLSRGDKLSFWMPEDRAGFYAQPGASETTRFAVVSTAPVER